ncbi:MULTISPECIES: OmpA family protein [Vibrio harveyi group]|uniref:OmpA family protein n=1 Tax=Vibrio harveyi group TaxID=717610 RepID=UPI002B21D2CA|nr:OmpA family protein [Vibrio parahaemolyticus]MEA5385429.1 OmpA family protein [Vibrio parahaemolyticus]
MVSKKRTTIACLMAMNLCACSSSAIRESHSILDFDWEADVYNMMYDNVEDADNLRLWVRRPPSFADGATHQLACVEVGQPGKRNQFYLANLNTYEVLSVYNCEGDYTASANIVPLNYYQRSDKEELLGVYGMSETLLDCGLYRFTFTNLFPVNKYELTEQGKVTLLKVIKRAQKLSVIHIRIYGVADSSGDYAHNQFLARARAQVVKVFLRKEGLNQVPISLRGSVENELPSAEERIAQRRFMIEMKLDAQ